MADQNYSQTAVKIKETEFNSNDRNPVPVVAHSLSVDEFPTLYQPIKANPNLANINRPQRGNLTPIEANYCNNYEDSPPSYISVTSAKNKKNCIRISLIFLVIFVLVAIIIVIVLKKVLEPKLCLYSEFVSKCDLDYDCGIGNSSDSVVLISIESNKYCIGTIISKRSVITSSNCLSNINMSPNSFKIRVASASSLTSNMLLYQKKGVESFKFFKDLLILKLDSDIDLGTNQAACFPIESNSYPKFKSTAVTWYSSENLIYDLNYKELDVSGDYLDLKNDRYQAQSLTVSGCSRMGAPLFTTATYKGETRFVLAGLALEDDCFIHYTFQDYVRLSASRYSSWIKASLLAD